MYATLCCDSVLGRTLEGASTPASRIHLASTPSIVQHSSAASGSDQIAPFRSCSQASVARRPPPRSLKICCQDTRARSHSRGEAGELSAQLSPGLERQLYVDSSRPLCANSGRSQTVRRTGQVDPNLPFEIDPMNERE